MPIEFRCTHCDKLLRTPDETAGKQAKCPQCGTVMSIPAAAAQPAAPGPTLPGGGQDPFGPAAATGSPFGAPAGLPPTSSDAENPYRSPLAAAAGPYQPVSQTFAPTQVSMEEIFSRTWAIFKDQWLACLGGWFIVMLLSLTVSQVLIQGSTFLGVGLGNRVAAIVLMVFAQLAANLFGLWLGIGLVLFVLRVARGEEAQFGTLFQGGTYLLPVLLASILYLLMVFFGLLLLIVPGIIFMLMFVQFKYLIIDRNVGVLDALSLSREAMRGNKSTVFGVYLVAGLVGGLFVLGTCGLGLLAYAPFMVLLPAVIYLSVTGQPTAAGRWQQAPAASPPGGEAPGGENPFAS